MHVIFSLVPFHLQEDSNLKWSNQMRANIIDLGQYKYTVNKHSYKDLHFTHPKHLLQPMSLFMVEWRKLILLYETEKSILCCYFSQPERVYMQN